MPVSSRLSIGGVSGIAGTVELCLMVDGESTAGVMLIATCPNAEKEEHDGAASILDAAGWEDFKALVERTDAAIRQLRDGRGVKVVADGFKLSGE